MPQPHTNGYTGKSDANANSYGYNYAGKSDADGHDYDHTTSISYANRDSDNHAETYADAKAAAHSLSSADAVTLAGSR